MDVLRVLASRRGIWYLWAVGMALLFAASALDSPLVVHIAIALAALFANPLCRWLCERQNETSKDAVRA